MQGPHVELDFVDVWVDSFSPIRDLLSTTFGFETIDLALDHRPGEKTTALACGGVTVVLRQGTALAGPIASHVAAHGDTVADVALVSPDPGAIVERAHAFGLGVFGPEDRPTIDLLGERTVCHSVRAVRVAPGARPGAGPDDNPSSSPDDNPSSSPGGEAASRMRAIDHVAYCLPWGTIEQTARLYEEVFGLERLDIGDCEVVGPDAIGMRSAVLRSGGGFTVVLTEPSHRSSSGQTQRFIDAHGGPGVQHVAIAYDDLVGAVESLRSRGVAFLSTPSEYFDDAQQRLPDASLPWDVLRRLEILVDSDENGLLLQLFTRPLGARPTWFFELIQRRGAESFGANNVRALFAAVQAAARAQSNQACGGTG